MKKFLLSGLMFSLYLNVYSQTNLPDFGSFTNSDVELKDCSFDKDAEAVIIFDYAYSNYDDEYQLITNRHVRMKILNQRGLENATIFIPFYSRDNYEIIRDIKGVTYNYGEKQPLTYLNPKTVYTEKKTSRVSYIKFAIPNAKVGSIIEYRYISVMKDYGGLDEWRFQSEIPTIKSAYRLQIRPNIEFIYVLSKKPDYPIIIKPKPEEGEIYFEMNNIPGLRFEPYMDAVKDYLQRVVFQFSGYVSSFGTNRKVNSSWKEVANTLATNEDLGAVLKKNIAVPDDLKILLAGKSNDIEKISTIYNYVRDNFTWNGHYGLQTDESLKKLLDKRSGNAAGINLVLVSFLQSANISAFPLAVAEREFGRVDPKIPLIDRFNKTIAYAVAGENKFILDATEKYSPAGITPYALLNTYALVIDKKNDKLIEIESRKESFKSRIRINSSIDKTGRISGEAKISSYEYAKQLQTGEIRSNQEKYIQTKLAEPYEGIKIEDFNVIYPTEDTAALLQEVEFSNDVNENGGFGLLKYNLFTGLTKNPFTTTERFTNINFGYPYDLSIEQVIDLPENSKTDNLPKNKTIKTGEGDIAISRQISKTGNRLIIKIDFKQDVTLVAYEDYNALKQFYKQAVELLNEPIVVQLTK